MLLRDHPLMMFRGNRSWPPDWLWRSGYDDTHPQGEVGILKSVTASGIQPYYRCFLLMEHCGAEYKGVLSLSDPAFWREVYRVLIRSSGKTIREIGETDLTNTHTALRSIAEMSSDGKDQDAFRLLANRNKLIVDENYELRHELRNHVTIMRFLRGSIREQIDAGKARPKPEKSLVQKNFTQSLRISKRF